MGLKVFLKYVVILLFFISIKTASAQQVSNEGTEFWLCFPAHEPSYNNATGSYSFANLSVFLTSKYDSKGRISCGNFEVDFTVRANKVAEIQVPRSVAYIEKGTGVYNNKAIHIEVEAGQPKVVAYAHIFAGARSAATLLLPVQTLGHQYYALSYLQQPENSGFSQFQVIACNPQTVIKVTPVINGVKGKAFQVTLTQAGDVYQYQNAGDVTGSTIEVDTLISPCKTIAVFSGSSATSIYGNSCSPKLISNSMDPLFQQLYSPENWGTTYALIPFYGRKTGSIYRFLAAADGTTVWYNGETVLLNKGQFYETAPSYSPAIIKSNYPVSVAQYALSQYCADESNQGGGNFNNISSDPDMVVLNPLEYGIRSITMYSSPKQDIQEPYLNVVLASNKIASFKINDVFFKDSFLAIPGTSLSYARIDLKDRGNNFTLTADTTFNAMAYGFGEIESYAYSAGTSLRATKALDVLSQTKGQPLSAACVGEGLSYRVILSYPAKKLIWLLEEGGNQIVTDEPFYSVSSVNGKTQYHYVLKDGENYTEKGLKQIRVVAFPLSPQDCGTTLIDTLYNTFEVLQKPVADFEMSVLPCSRGKTQFAYQESLNNRQIVSWQWDFGDGSSSQEENPVHEYAKEGEYTVKLSIKDKAGCFSEVVEKQLIIPSFPIADFKVEAPFCVERDVAFSDLSAVRDESIVSWQWDFGDGSAAVTSPNPIHRYGAAGTYFVKLLITASGGCSDPVIKPLVIHDPVSADFDYPPSCEGESVLFTASASGEVASWHWDFGDHSEETAENFKAAPTHHFSTHGNYEVRLSVTATSGCVTEIIKSVQINSSELRADFDVLDESGLCGGSKVFFKNTSDIRFGEISRLEWLFDFENGQQVNVTDSFPEPGKIYEFNYPALPQVKEYAVVMKAYSGTTCYGETTPRKIKVNEGPLLIAKAIKPLCTDDVPFALVVEDKNQIAGKGIFKGKGVTANGFFDPAGAGPGDHDITYVFESNKGCIDSIVMRISVEKLPEISAGNDQEIVLSGETILHAKGDSTEGITYQWFPSEGLSNSEILHPVASPRYTTTYTLIATSSSGCKFADQVTVTVHEALEIPNAFSPNGDGYNDYWVVDYLESLPNADIKIFNRYGQVVFDAHPYQTPWDGKFKGKDLPAGVYYFIIVPNDGGTRRYSGALNLIR